MLLKINKVQLQYLAFCQWEISKRKHLCAK